MPIANAAPQAHAKAGDDKWPSPIDQSRSAIGRLSVTMRGLADRKLRYKSPRESPREKSDGKLHQSG